VAELVNALGYKLEGLRFGTLRSKRFLSIHLIIPAALEREVY
jgi:hypothetical protein